MAYITEITTWRAHDTGHYSKRLCLETAASDRIHVQSFLQSELGKCLLFPVRSTFLSGGAFLVWWVETQTMAGTHSSHVYTMEEVLGMLDTVDEPICDRSDDDFDTDYLNYDDQEMTR